MFALKNFINDDSDFVLSWYLLCLYAGHIPPSRSYPFYGVVAITVAIMNGKGASGVAQDDPNWEYLRMELF